MARIQRYAPDTNFYLHAKAPDQIPWADVTDAETIELIVLDEVLKELDRHKAAGNGRLARRARKIFTFIDPLIDDAVEEVEARKSKPRVVWRLAPLLATDRSRPAGLDLTSADGRIIEEALAVREVLGGEMALLTHDRLPRRLATTVGLDRQRVPEEWLLPPEPDERERENARLREKLNEWENRSPKIQFNLLEEGCPISRVGGNLPRYQEISVEFLEDALRKIETQHPREKISDLYQHHSAYETSITKYKDERDEWVRRIRDTIKSQPERLNHTEGVRRLTLSIENVGSMPASGLIVKVTSNGNIRILNHNLSDIYFPEIDRIHFPLPPKIEMYHGIHLGRLMATSPFQPEDAESIFERVQPKITSRDNESVYFDYEDNGLIVNSVTATCGEFRHQTGGVLLDLLICVPTDNRSPAGSLQVKASAKNIPELLEKSYPVRFDFDWKNSDDRIRSLLS